jgi:hypothetical protein
VVQDGSLLDSLAVICLGEKDVISIKEPRRDQRVKQGCRDHGKDKLSISAAAHETDQDQFLGDASHHKSQLDLNPGLKRDTTGVGLSRHLPCEVSWCSKKQRIAHN